MYQEYLTTVEVVSRFEVMVTAPDDESIFSFNGLGSASRLSQEAITRIKNIQYEGKEISKKISVVEVIEGED